MLLGSLVSWDEMYVGVQRACSSSSRSRECSSSFECLDTAKWFSTLAVVHAAAAHDMCQRAIVCICSGSWQIANSGSMMERACWSHFGVLYT
jgi:transcriptional regulator GlxA family with amidase domain